MATISGTVVDGVGNPVSRVVRLYRQDSGAFVAQAVSDATTGAYSFTVANTDKHFVVAQDNANLVDPYWASVVFMLELPATNDGTSFPDKTGKTVTRLGNVVTKTGTTKYGPASAYFDGSGDYLRCDAVAAALIGATEFTIDGWFQLTADGSEDAALLSFHSSTGSNRNVLTVANMFGSTFTTQTFASKMFASSLGTWKHVAYEFYDGVFYAYLDGVIIGSATGTNGIVATDTFTIGQEFDSGPTATNFFTGYVDNRFRVTKSARHKGAAFTPDAALAPTNLISGVTKNAVIFDAVVPV